MHHVTSNPDSDFDAELEAEIAADCAGDESWFETPILDDLQFTNADVLAITELSPAQLSNWLSRDWGLNFKQSNPGKGKRRLFSGLDIITIEVAQALTPFSLVKVASQMAQTGILHGRADALIRGHEKPDLAYFLCLSADGSDWLYLKAGTEPVPTPSAVYLQLDLIIAATLDRLQLTIDGETVPPKERLIAPTPEESAAEVEDFFGVSDADEQGRKILSGLTFEEARELTELRAVTKDERRADPAIRHRKRDLEDKHELGRLMKIGASIAENGNGDDQ